MSGLGTAFANSVDPETPLDGTSNGDKNVSTFITVSSLTNFSAMTGAIAAAWGALRKLSDAFDSQWIPFGFCVTFALISVIASTPGWNPRKWLPALFIAFVNSFTLFGAVVGASEVSTDS